ncbi:MAG: DEAD/DEAH box helicase [Patescibacteria group bacterium]
MTYRVAVSDAAVNQTLGIISTPLYQEKGAAFWFLQNNKEIKIWADLLVGWQKNLPLGQKEIITWPESEPMPIATFLAYQKNQNYLILTTINNLATLVPDWLHFKNRQIQLNKGQEYPLHQLVTDLVAMGFSRESSLANYPSLAVRGQLVDIYQNFCIYRIEYDFNKIKSLLVINTLDNQSQDVSNITIWPDNIFQKQKFINSIPAACLLIYNLTDQENFPLAKNKQIIIDPLSKKPDFELPGQNLNFLFSQKADKIKFLQEQTDYQIFWFSKQPVLAQEIIKKYQLPAKIIDWQAALSWPEIMCLPTAKIITVHDQLFFLAETGHTTGTVADWLPDFTVGDLVVHRDHGIAKLTGIQKMTIDEVEHEYLVLTYAQNDTLFVPVDLADKVEKYLGPANPKINRLSIGNAWPQTLRKIKNQTLELANQLLTIEATRRLHSAPKINEADLEEKVAADFTYQLTPSQKAAWQDVQTDLQATWPQDRLICGDVGFGKTEIALRAAARVVSSGYQVALLCPTTILAQQHFDNFSQRLSKFGVRVALLTRWQKPAQIQKTCQALKNNQIDIVIGTHRLLSRDVQIPKLQLLIIDEEQNFGVADKEKLKKYKSNIHVLTLTATPIPRTLHLALSLIKDISLITHPIANRKDIITEVLPENDDTIKQAIERELKRRGQIYFLHNKVETIDFAYKKIKKMFPKAGVAIAHGQLPDTELADIMHKFDTGKIDILICSTIIANGLDIPNANTLIVTEATRFGLSQLHQLRGRIGRSDIQAYAYFLYTASHLAKLPTQRLAHLKQASSLGDGFKIASRDLELRGVGQILGKAQSGKVKSIGLGLYQILVAETIAELKGQINKPWRDIEIKLPIDTSVPNKMFSSLADKIVFYQKVSRQRDIDHINEKINQAHDQALKNIWLLQKIKVLAQNKNISSIYTYRSQDKKYLAINFLGAIDFKKIDKIMDHNPSWRYANHQLKIDQDFLKTNLASEIEDIIKLLTV